MKRIAALSLTGLLALSACGGSSSLPSAGTLRATAGAKLAPYAMPIVTDPRVQAAERAFKATLRGVKNSYGGVPTVDGSAAMMDAPNFGPGAQVNVAVMAVNAMSNGTAYPLAQYASPVVINVLNYQSSALALGSNPIPAIAYDGVEYVTDVSHSNVVVNGVTYPMVFGSFANRTFTASNASTAKIYFPSPADGTQGPVSFLMDFNAAQWVKLRNGIAEVGPRGKATVLSRAAVIDGTVVNAAGQPVSGASVVAYAADGSRARATVTGADGTFELHAIDAGTYSIVIFNTYAPDDADDTMIATGNDAGTSVNGPTISVPSGYRINLGQIND